MYKTFFTFDFLSPFSYLCFKILKRDIEQLNNTELILRPVTMAMLIKEFQPVGPAEIPVKRDYLTKECARISSIEEIPFNAPFKLPFISTDLLRATCALSEQRIEQWELADLIFTSVWENGIDPEDLNSILESSHFSDEIKEKSNDKFSRKTLKLNTRNAINEKLFGVPAFSVYKNENLIDTFWGLSSMEHLKMFLNGDLNINQTTIDNFSKLFFE